MRRFWVLLLVVGVVAALGPAGVADTDPRVPGKYQWTRQFGTSETDFGRSVAVNASGVYVTGSTAGDLPGWNSQGNDDVLVRAYDHTGKHRWTRQFGTSGWDEGRGVAVNASRLYVVGYTDGALPGETHLGGQDVFVRAYDSAGKHRWTRQFGTNFTDEGLGVATNASGVYVVGYTGGALPGQARRGELDVFVRKYDHSGKHQWTRQFGTSESELGWGVAVDASGVYVTGHTLGAFPGWTNRGDTDVFVRKYDHSGKHQWTRQFGTDGRDMGKGVAVDASGLYVVGYTGGALPGQAHRGELDVFVRKYDHSGNHQWTRQFGTSTSDYGEGVAVNTSGVYVTGLTAGALPNQTHRGGNDVFVRSYTHAGAHRWTRQFGTSSSEEGSGIATGAAAVYVTGYTLAALPGQTHQGVWDVFLRKYATQ